MAIAIREFSTPNYAEHIPADDKEERTIQKIEKFATFLNELPWFGKKKPVDTSNENGIAADTAVTKKAADEAATKAMLEGADMGKLATADANADTFGITPDMAVELKALQDAKDADEFAKALQAAEASRWNVNEPQASKSSAGYDYDPKNAIDGKLPAKHKNVPFVSRG